MVLAKSFTWPGSSASNSSSHTTRTMRTAAQFFPHATDASAGDLVAARVAGSPYSRGAFEMVRPLLRSDGLRVGGVGLKIHPDFKYANLYHRVVGDTTWWKGTMGIDLPCCGRPYYADDGEPPELSQTA